MDATWLTDHELDAIDAYLRGETPGNGPTTLAMLDSLGTILRAYPRITHELRALRGEAQRLRQHVAQASAESRKLETELQLTRAKIDGLERQLRAA